MPDHLAVEGDGETVGTHPGSVAGGKFLRVRSSMTWRGSPEEQFLQVWCLSISFAGLRWECRPQLFLDDLAADINLALTPIIDD